MNNKQAKKAARGLAARGQEKVPTFLEVYIGPDKRAYVQPDDILQVMPYDGRDDGIPRSTMLTSKGQFGYAISGSPEEVMKAMGARVLPGIRPTMAAPEKK